MLLLTQRIGDTVRIGEDGEINVTILGISGNQVRVGYNAPEDVPIHREKIFKLIQKERESVNKGE